MGSKRSMLANGLGELLRSEAQSHSRIVDLFSGSASVAWFAAQEMHIPVLATDLQSYSSILARSVIGRTKPIVFEEVWPKWKEEIRDVLHRQPLWKLATALEGKYNTPTWCKKARELCSNNIIENGVIWSAYGGYYFSPAQALTFDAMLRCVPSHEPLKSVYMACVIASASKCAASPGHTAQPFRPTTTAGPYLREAWEKDPFEYFVKTLKDICPRHAQIKGSAKVADALKEAKKLNDKDLVFIDPPYSGVHYSRFYHVLETIARGNCGPVTGDGRYPPFEERPQSLFSNKSEAKLALTTLLEALAEAGSTVLFTFPASRCSNGLSGNIIEKQASKWFVITKRFVTSQFSTLGGNNSHRKARNRRKELFLLMRPIKSGLDQG